MLKALARTPKGPYLLVGLSEENVLRLKNDRPLVVGLKEFGLPSVEGTLFMFYGRTELEMATMLQRGGLIDPVETERIEDPELTAHRALADNEAKVLVATVGLPRSGKSTWARSQSYPIVCPDEIRTALHGHRFIAEAEPFIWAICKVMVRSLFGAGHQFVILDATNITRKRRDEWRSSEWALRFKYIDTPASVCHERAEAENDSSIHPIIADQAERLELLGEDELVFH